MRRLCVPFVSALGLVVLVAAHVHAASDEPPGPGDTGASPKTENVTALAEAPKRDGVDEAAKDGAADELEKAKELFRKGNLFRKAGDCRRAVEYFARSRSLVASIANTLNGAICMDRLGRFDEALELYERVLVDFSSSISEGNRNALAPKLRRLRSEVGSVDVAANAVGHLVVDGRPRGKLPLLSPVRVMPGEHTVAVLAEGFAPYTERVVVEVGQTFQVVAKLELLANAGTLDVSASELEGAKIFIDGAHVATAPWSGKLSPGRHIVFLRHGDRGSAPQILTIVDQRQTVLATKLVPLGPRQLFSVEPAGASLTIDEVEMATGRWQGRLPVGPHKVNVHRDGYHAATRAFEVRPEQADDIHVILKIDSVHPRWRKPSEPGMIWLEAHVGAAFGGSLGSDSESYCKQGRCTSNEDPLGFLSGASVGYEWPLGVSVFATGAYFRLNKNLQREFTKALDTTPPTATRYLIADSLELSGGLAGIGMGYRYAFNPIWSVRAQAAIGAMFTTSRDTVGGYAQQGNQVALAKVIGSGEPLTGVNLFVAPALQLAAKFGGFYTAFGFGAVVATLDGIQATTDPTTHKGELVVISSEPCAPDSRLACSPNSGQLASERASGRFVFWRPALSLGYVF